MHYVLLGVHAVRLNGFLRATEDIDVLLPCYVENVVRVIKEIKVLDIEGLLKIKTDYREKDLIDKLALN